MTKGVYRNLKQLARDGDGLEYNPQLLGQEAESLRQYLDSKKKTDDV